MHFGAFHIRSVLVLIDLRSTAKQCIGIEIFTTVQLSFQSNTSELLLIDQRSHVGVYALLTGRIDGKCVIPTRSKLIP